MTNFEKIKAMSLEEMAARITSYADCDYCNYCPAFKFCNSSGIFGCYEVIEKWLESEVDKNERNIVWR